MRVCLPAVVSSALLYRSIPARATLTTCDSPFVCLYCSWDLRHAALNQLQDKVRVLKAEVSELLAACDSHMDVVADAQVVLLFTV